MGVHDSGVHALATCWRVNVPGGDHGYGIGLPKHSDPTDVRDAHDP